MPRVAGAVVAASGKHQDVMYTEQLPKKRSASWDSGDPALSWTVCRRSCDSALRSNAAQASVMLLTLVSFVLIVVETDWLVEEEIGQKLPMWMMIANTSVLAAFVVEITMRLYVWRCEFFHGCFNILDLVIVLVDSCSEILSYAEVEAVPSLTVFRVFRLARLVRGVRVIVNFPQLSIMVKGLMSAMSTIFWGVCFLIVVLLIWGVLAVQIIHPLNQDIARSSSIYSGCDRCPHAFESVGQSMLTFTQQIVAGDSWGMVTLPILEEWPLSVIFFGLVFISVNLALLNVMLAVIVDSALKVSDADVQEVLRQKASGYNAVKGKLQQYCKDMDTDGSGDLTLQELITGYDTNQEFGDLLKAMDIGKADMQVVHAIMDADSNGSINYDEFIEELFKMKTHDTHTMLIFIKFYVTEIRNKMQEQLRILRADVIRKIEERESQVSVVHTGDHASSLPAEMKMKPPLLAGQAEPANDLGEELRRLRTVIGEDLVRSMQEVAQKSEDHTRLLASIAERTPNLFATERGSSIVWPELQSQAVSKAIELSRESAAAGGNSCSTHPAGNIPWPRRAPTSSWALRSCCEVKSPTAKRRVLEPKSASQPPPDNSTSRPGGA